MRMKQMWWLAPSLFVAAATLDLPASDPAFRFVGRFDGGRFDHQGCEIQFRISGATTLAARIAQRLGAEYESGGSGGSRSGGDVTSVKAASVNTDDADNAYPHDFIVFIDGAPLLTPIAGSRCAHCTFDTVGIANETVTEYVLASNLSRGAHEVRIQKVTEPMLNGRAPSPNWVTFHGLRLDAGTVSAPLTPKKSRRIEFVGDSISAGYCNLCDLPRSSGIGAGNNVSTVEQESFALSWPTLICEALDAECSTVAWSGIGLIQNCCGGDTFMPEIWMRTLATGPTAAWNAWDFSQWVPEALVVNLGTNDGKVGATDAFAASYIQLVLKAVELYGESLQVFLACGPMSEEYCNSVWHTLESAAGMSIKAHFLDQRGFLNGTYGPACCNHPGAQVDAAMGRAGAERIAQVMGWHEFEEVQIV